MKIPAELLYSTDHEWVKVENGKAIIGITDFAQDNFTLGKRRNFIPEGLLFGNISFKCGDKYIVLHRFEPVLLL